MLQPSARLPLLLPKAVQEQIHSSWVPAFPVPKPGITTSTSHALPGSTGSPFCYWNSDIVSKSHSSWDLPGSTKEIKQDVSNNLWWIGCLAKGEKYEGCCCLGRQALCSSRFGLWTLSCPRMADSYCLCTPFLLLSFGPC